LPQQRSENELPPAVAEALDAVRPERLVALLQQLVAVPSETGSAAESEAQHLLARVLDDAGTDVDLWPLDLPVLTTDPEFPGCEAPREEGWGLVATAGGEDGPTLVLNGHIDVVPPGERSAWSVDPWSAVVRGGRVVGRGTCDMKAGLVSQVVALEALRAAGVQLRGRVQLQSVVGEEDGGLGTFATLRRGYRGDVAVIGEPTRGDLVTASAGALTFRLRVPGLSAHGSMRLAGVDAVEKYLHVHRALRALEARRNRDTDALMRGHELPYPVSVGRVRAGEWASTVPDLLVAEGRYGVALGEPVEEARRELEQAVAEACASDPWLREHPVEVEWWGGQFASGRLQDGSGLPAAVAAAHRAVTGRESSIGGVTYGSDQRLLAGIGGVPTVLYGPGDVRHAHAPDESVAVQEMVDVARALVLLAVQVCGVQTRSASQVR
jgi:acetylornithine deacetylase